MHTRSWAKVKYYAHRPLPATRVSLVMRFWVWVMAFEKEATIAKQTLCSSFTKMIMHCMPVRVFICVCYSVWVHTCSCARPFLLPFQELVLPYLCLCLCYLLWDFIFFFICTQDIASNWTLFSIYFSWGNLSGSESWRKMINIGSPSFFEKFFVFVLRVLAQFHKRHRQLNNVLALLSLKSLT